MTETPLKLLRKRAGLTLADLAEKADTTAQQISRLERGERTMSVQWAKKLAPILELPFTALLEGADGQVEAPTTVRIPDLAIYGGMGGGGALEIYVDESGSPTDPSQLRGFWALPDYMVDGFRNLQHIYAWEVRGDSMEPTLPGGSVVFVDTSQNRPPPDDIYAINFGDGLMVKRLKLVPRTDLVSVISDNDRYRADDLPRDEVHIWGRVVGWFQWRA